MKRSTERILTIHTGSLPRPDDLLALPDAQDHGTPPDPAVLATRVQAVTAEMVRTQISCGVDIVNDGEVGKISYCLTLGGSTPLR
jgi:5-methyltetrahydropteroyltriglutamate--homocysteine methyltransferase